MKTHNVNFIIPFFLSAVFLPGIAAATVSSIVTIKNIQTAKTNTATIIISANHGNTPNCPLSNRMIINISTTSGRAMLATALSAQMTSRAVKLVGTNACYGGSSGQAEELQMIMTYDY